MAESINSVGTIEEASLSVTSFHCFPSSFIDVGCERGVKVHKKIRTVINIYLEL